MKCKHTDCLTCPYEECVESDRSYCHRPGYVPESKQDYYQRRRDELLAYQNQYYKDNTEKRLAYQKEYDKRPEVRERKRLYNAKYRAEHKAELEVKRKAKKEEKCAAEPRGDI